MIYTAKIEQTSAYQKRMKYIAETDSFIQEEYDSLFYARNFMQPYGWIKESGTPPNKHLDVLIMTGKEYSLGDEERVRIIGVFCRNDGDNKLVSVPVSREIKDLSELSESEREDLHRLYPRADKGEGWFGNDAAEKVIKVFFEK